MTSSVNWTVDSLPAELWLRVFGNIAESEPRPQHTLANISLTCQPFRCFVLPLMCRTFVLHPFVVDVDTREPWDRSQQFMPPPNRMEHELRRLDFYSSDSIAVHVRHLDLLPWFEPRVVSETASDDLNILFRKFYETLPRFTNAQCLKCTNTDIDGFALQQLCGLPNLRSLSLIGCSAPPLSSPVNDYLHLHTFKFWHHARPEALQNLGVDRWLSLIDANRLEILHLSPGRTSSLFFRDIGNAGPFPSLCTLRASLSTNMLAQMPSLLSKTPAIRCLDVSILPTHAEEHKRTAEGLRSSLTAPTPYLAEYRGPHELLHVILGRSAMGSQPQLLRRLHLTSLAREGEPFAAFLHTLFLRPAYSTQLKYLTHFHVQLRSIEYDHLSRLCLLFPELQELSLEAEDRSAQVTQAVSGRTFQCNKLLTSHLTISRPFWTI
jgi:hypothetical protein